MKWDKIPDLDLRTAAALHGSIFKWEQIKEGNIVCLGQNNCPLCHLYWNTSPSTIDGSCTGCPVFEKTGKTGCQNTPLAMMDNLDFENTDEGYHPDVQQVLLKYLHLAEIEFLKSLPGKRILTPEIREDVEYWVLEKSGLFVDRKERD